jgi:nucleotide-binding universal stress UspA family protein
MPEIRRIVCPVDFSEPSEHALQYATDLAQRFGARLELVHAYELPTYALPDGAVFAGADFETKLSNELQARLDEQVDKAKQAGLSVDGHLLRGVAHKEIVRFSEENGADLVVMGTHGRTGLEHVLLGSVAERVVRMATMPVLTVRQQDAKK